MLLCRVQYVDVDMELSIIMGTDIEKLLKEYNII